MKYSRRAISIHNLDRHVYYIPHFFRAAAAPTIILQLLIIFSHLRNLCHERFDRMLHSSICCKLRIFQGSYLLRLPFSFSHYLNQILRFIHENYRIRSSCVLLLVYRYSSLLMYRSCRAIGCYFKGVAINISFHHLKSFHHQFLLSFDISWPVRILDTIDCRHPAGRK